MPKVRAPKITLMYLGILMYWPAEHDQLQSKIVGKTALSSAVPRRRHPMPFTVQQIRDMVLHIQACPMCAAGDEELAASVYDESLPPEELAAFIAAGHSPEWQSLLTRHGTGAL